MFTPSIINNLMVYILILCLNAGVVTHSSQLPQQVDENDLNLLSACMQLENGDNGDRCLLLTGSVVLNRVYYCSWCPNTVEGVLYQKGQYASHTVKNLKTVLIPERTRILAKFLLIYGPICPKNVIFQSQQKNLGNGHYDIIETPDGPEYFAFE